MSAATQAPRLPPKAKLRTEGLVGSAVRHAILIVLVILCLAPIVWLLITAFKPYGELFSSPPTLFPIHPTLVNFAGGWSVGGGRGIRDSLIVASSSTVLCLILGFPAAYALARRFAAHGQLSFTILSLRMLPPIVPVIGFYLMFQKLHLYDTYIGLIIAYTFMNLPLVIWLLAEFIRQIPRSYEDAARIDGAPWFWMFRDILLPLSAPGIMTAAILSMMFAWNEFLFSLVLTGDNVITLPKALADFFLFQEPNWGQLGAIGIVAMGPLLVLSYLMQRYLIRSFTAELGGR
jgi:multiple sugar transport system permease protein